MAVAARGASNAMADEIRRRIAISATVTVVGIALSTASESVVGGLVTVCGVVALIWNVHRLGRAGPG